MSVFVALLRGINVGGHHKIKMAALKESLGTLCFQNVETYLQSGNIIFESSCSEISILKEKIAQQILIDFGYKIPVLIFSKNTFLKGKEKNPFINKTTVDIKKLYITFLNKKPDIKLFSIIKENPKFSEKMVLDSAIIYLYYTNNFGKSKINNNFWERQLGIAATTRNWNTVCNLYEKLQKRALVK